MANIDRIRAALEGKLLGKGILVDYNTAPPYLHCALGELLSVAGVTDEQMLERQHNGLSYRDAFPELGEVYGLDKAETGLIWAENDFTEDPADRAEAVIHALEVWANG